MQLFLRSLLLIPLLCTCVSAQNEETSTKLASQKENAPLKEPTFLDTLTALVEQLKDLDESIALETYRDLATYPSGKLRLYNSRFRGSDFSKSVNEVVPANVSVRLPVLAEMTEYCQDRGFSISPPVSLTRLLVQIDTTVNSLDRRRLSQKLLERITMENVTALERQMFIHHRQWPKASYALSWALNYWYHENWPRIAADPEHLDLYIAKVYWFSSLGSGSKGIYSSRIKAGGAKVWEATERFKNQHPRRFVKHFFTDVLARADTIKGLVPIHVFVGQLARGLYPDPKRVEVDSSGAIFTEIFELMAQKGEAIASPALRYLTRISHPGITPYLLDLIDDERIVFHDKISDAGRRKKPEDRNVVSAGDIAVTFLEGIHHHAFSIQGEEERGTPKRLKFSFYKHLMTGRHKTGPQWKQLYKDTGGDVKEWASFFHRQRFKTLLAADTITIDQVNVIIEDLNWEPKKFSKVKKVLEKVKPRKDLLRLRLPDGQSLTRKQFPLFANLKLTQRDLRSIVRQFKKVEAPEILPFLQGLANKFHGKERGYAWLNLFEGRGLETNIPQGDFPELMLETILQDLEKFGASVKSTHPFAQRARTLSCKLTLADLSLEQQLAIISSDTTGTYHRYFGLLFYTSSYEDLPLFLKAFPELDIPLRSWEFQLRTNWALPVPTPLTLDIIADLRSRVEQQPEEEVRRYYLQQLGIEVPEQNDELKVLRRLETVYEYVPGGNIGEGVTLEEVATALRRFKKENR